MTELTSTGPSTASGPDKGNNRLKPYFVRF